MAIAVSAGLVLFTASVMCVGAAAESAEEKVTCVQMMVGTEPRKCVHNLFNSLQVQLEEGVPIPIVETYECIYNYEEEKEEWPVTMTRAEASSLCSNGTLVEVRQRPALYDQRLKSYRDKQLQNDAWLEF
ncbi:hypothetical protein HPB52_020473 [Rhipicephalus sanguineus]|uniref:MADF domain-containing protein n=1 Tax=Rhipicephalus sanguineus TaxID=34632 RepID=A0A9D4PXL4_RHISA|nr:hypothetical protein HPB52_020473 [Rhipicephalus sanguineus]